MATHYRITIDERTADDGSGTTVPTILLETANRTGIDETIVSRYDAHLQQMICHIPLVVTLSNATEVDCAQCSMKREEIEARLGHLADAYRVSISGRTNDLAGVDRGDLVTFRGDSRRVIAVDVSPDGYETRLHLGDNFARG